MNIIPSIFVSDKKTFQKQIQSLDGIVDTAQIDIADGEFVEAVTWSHDHVDELLPLVPSSLNLELHLMVKNPLEELKKWQRAEAVIRIFVHYEAVEDLSDILPTLHAYGWEIGIAINPETPLSVLTPYLKEIKAVLFMGVTPGKQGQTFHLSTLKKIQDFRMADNGHWLAVDGGVNEKTITDIMLAGADAVCPGSAVFGNRKKPSTNIKELQKVCTV